MKILLCLLTFLAGLLLWAAGVLLLLSLTLEVHV